MEIVVALAGVLTVANCYSPPPQVAAVVSYFRAVNVNTVSLLLCSPDYEKLKMTRALSSAGFQVSQAGDFGRNSIHRSGALLDASCKTNFLGQGLERWLSSGLVEWLVYGEESSDLPALPDSAVTLYLEDGRLVDYFRPRLGLPPLTAEYSPPQPRPHGDFRGADIYAAHLQGNKTNQNNKSSSIFGELECLDSPAGGWSPNMSLELVYTLADQLNFTLDLVKASGCGDLQSMLHNRTVAFSTTAIMLTEPKLKFIEFSTQLFQIKARVVYKQPGLSSVFNIYQLPFQSGVWLSCLGTVLTTGAVLLVGLKAGGAFEEHFVGPAELFTLVIGFVCQQGTHLNPMSLSVRTTIVVFSVSALFLYTSYSANIVALLQSTKPTVKTVQELASSPLKLLLEDTTYNRAYFKEDSDNPKIRLLVKEKKINDKSYVSLNDAVVEMRKGTAAINVERSAAYHRVSELFEEREKCGLSELEVLPLPVLALPTAAGSGYRDHFARKLGRQLEMGLVQRARLRSVTPRPRCTSVDGGFVSVGLTDFWPALLVLLYGLAAALAAFILEILTASIQKTKPVRFKDIDYADQALFKN